MELSPHTAQGAQPQAVAPVERLGVGAGISLYAAQHSYRL